MAATASKTTTPTRRPGRPPKSAKDGKNLTFIINETTSTTSAESETTTLVRTTPTKKVMGLSSNSSKKAAGRRKSKNITPSSPPLPSLGMYTSSPIESPLTNRKRRHSGISDNQNMVIFGDLASSPLRGRVNYHPQREIEQVQHDEAVGHEATIIDNGIPSSPIFSSINEDDADIFSPDNNIDSQIFFSEKKINNRPLFQTSFEPLTRSLTPSSIPAISSSESKRSFSTLSEPELELENFDINNHMTIDRHASLDSSLFLYGSTNTIPINTPPSKKIRLVINNGRAEVWVPPPTSTNPLPHIQIASPSLSPSPAITANPVSSWTTDSDNESDFESNTESDFQKYGIVNKKLPTSDAIAAFARTIARSNAKVTRRKVKGSRKHRRNHHSTSHHSTSGNNNTSHISPSTLRYINSSSITSPSATFDGSPLSFFLDSQKYQNTLKTGFAVPVRCVSPSSPNLYDPELLSSDTASTPPGSVMLLDDIALGTYGTGMTPYLPGRH